MSDFFKSLPLISVDVLVPFTKTGQAIGRIDRDLPPALYKALQTNGVRLMCLNGGSEGTWFSWCSTKKDWIVGDYSDVVSWIKELSIQQRLYWRDNSGTGISVPIRLSEADVTSIAKWLSTTPLLYKKDAMTRFQRSPWSRWNDLCVKVDDNLQVVCEPVKPDHFYKVSIGVDWYQTYKDDQLLNGFLGDMCTPSSDSGLSSDEIYDLENWRRDCILYFCGALILRKPCFALGLISEPGRGKGTLLKLIESLIPDKSVKSYISLHRLDDISNMEALCRSSLNVEYDEVTKYSVSAKSTAELKKIVLGEPCQVRKLYANSYNIEPRVAMLLASNKEPKFETEDEAIFDRFIFIEVGQNIGNMRTNGEGNINLSRDLTTDARRKTFAIMAVQKWIEITAKGIDLRSSVWAQKARQKSAMGSTGATQFLADYYSQSEGAVIGLNEVYSHFTSVTPVTYQVTIKAFAEKLKGLGVRVDKYTSRKAEYAHLRGKPCIFGWEKNTESYDSLGSEIMTALSTMN